LHRRCHISKKARIMLWGTREARDTTDEDKTKKSPRSWKRRQNPQLFAGIEGDTPERGGNHESNKKGKHQRGQVGRVATARGYNSQGEDYLAKTTKSWKMKRQEEL